MKRNTAYFVWASIYFGAMAVFCTAGIWDGMKNDFLSRLCFLCYIAPALIWYDYHKRNINGRLFLVLLLLLFVGEYVALEVIGRLFFEGVEKVNRQTKRYIEFVVALLSYSVVASMGFSFDEKRS